MQKTGMAQRFRIARKKEEMDWLLTGGPLVELWTDALPSARACRGKVCRYQRRTRPVSRVVCSLCLDSDDTAMKETDFDPKATTTGKDGWRGDR
jgi:hypothetical protein